MTSLSNQMEELQDQALRIQAQLQHIEAQFRKKENGKNNPENYQRILDSLTKMEKGIVAVIDENFDWNLS